MASGSKDHITSGNVLTWAKRVEAQRAQADAMNNIAVHKEFYKIKVSRTMHKESPTGPAQLSNPVRQARRYCNRYMARYAQNATRLVTSRESAGVKRAEQYMK